MNKSTRLKALIEMGYFPGELPPPFSTSDLAKFRSSVAKAWTALSDQYPKTSPEIYSIPRIAKVRRNLAVVNPIAQLYLAKLIADNWMEIRKHLKQSQSFVEVPEVSFNGSRAVSKPDFTLVSLRRLEISSIFDHALVSDISRFYGTLYTHAIPWALHGKKWCKIKLHKNVYKGSLGARLDEAVRKGQDNQTIGIPVGPDTSRIISEIVGVAIDQHILKRIDLSYKTAFRHIDDWYIGFDNLGAAESAIAILATACREFELELNSEKTKSLHAASNIENLWPTELREFLFKDTEIGQSRSLEHYFTKAFTFSKQFSEQNVLDFAIKRTKGIKILEPNWHSYETFLLKAVRTNNSVLPAVVEILISYNLDNYSLGRERINKLIEDLIFKNAPLAHHAEVSWALFLAKALSIKISKIASKQISELESSICGLLALDLNSKGLIHGSLDTHLWRSSMSAEGLRSNMWLLAYEADLKGWLTAKKPNFINDDPYFSVLKSKKISFYNSTYTVIPISEQKPKSHSSAFREFLENIGLESNVHVDLKASNLERWFFDLSG